MSFINKNLALVEGPEQTNEEFFRFGDQPRIGLEKELHFVDADLNGASIKTFNALRENLTGKADISVEAASTMFEVKNDLPFTAAQGPQAAVDELTQALTTIEPAIAELGHKILPYSLLPWSDYRDLSRTHIHQGPNPRPQSFINFFMANNPARARNFISVAGVQSSMTTGSALGVLQYFNRLAHIAPVLASVMSSVPPFAHLDDNKFGAVRSNLTLARRLQTAGGTQNAFPVLGNIEKIDEAGAKAFLSGWNEQVWDTRLFNYYDPETEDSYTRLRYFDEPGQMTSFRDLPKELQTRENYIMASSIQYGLITMSYIPDTPAGPSSRRVEARFFDTGAATQEQGVAAISFALAADENFGNAVDQFAADCGFSPDNPAASIPLLTKTLDSVAKANFKSFADLRFGKTNLLEAAHKFHRDVTAPMLDRFPGLAQIDRDCETGSSPAMRFREAVGRSPKRFVAMTRELGPLYPAPEPTEP